jgi:uncharacterized membrane protein
MTETRPDALTELVRILREQLTRKDERIANLETLLKEANLRLEEQQRLLEYLLGRENTAHSAPTAAHPPLPAKQSAPPAPPSSPLPAHPQAAAPEPPVSSAHPEPPVSSALSEETEQAGSPTQERPPIPLSALISPIPGMDEMIQATAEQVISAAQSAEASSAEGEEQREITARFHRDQLRKGHREHEARKRGLWRRFFSRPE